MPQADVEGDFRPWQSFAYALLAGVPRDTVMTPGGDTLSSVIAHSTDLCVDEPEDLGHALVTLGMLPAVDRPAVLRFGGVDTPVELLVGHAIRAHYLGHFWVCHMFHLTEGIVLAVARLPGLQRFAAYPTEFVAGQMRVLKVLAVLLRLLPPAPGRRRSRSRSSRTRCGWGPCSRTTCSTRGTSSVERVRFAVAGLQLFRSLNAWGRPATVSRAPDVHTGRNGYRWCSGRASRRARSGDQGQTVACGSSGATVCP